MEIAAATTAGSNVELAPELWLSIFANLPPLSQIAASDTCSGWRTLMSSSPILWSSFTLTGPPPTIDVQSHVSCAGSVSRYIKNRYPPHLLNYFDGPLPVCNRTGQLSPTLSRVFSYTGATQLSISIFLPHHSDSPDSRDDIVWPCILDLLGSLISPPNSSDGVQVTDRVRDMVVIVDHPGQLHKLMKACLNRIHTFALVSLLDVAAAAAYDVSWKYTVDNDLPPLSDLAEYISPNSSRLRELRYSHTLVRLCGPLEPPLTSLQSLDFAPCHPAEIVTALLSAPKLRHLRVAVGSLYDWVDYDEIVTKFGETQRAQARDIAAALDTLEIKDVDDRIPSRIAGILDCQRPRAVYLTYGPCHEPPSEPAEDSDSDDESPWYGLHNIDFSILTAVTIPTHASIIVSLNKYVTFSMSNAHCISRAVTLPYDVLSPIHRSKALSTMRLTDGTSLHTLESLHINLNFLPDIALPRPLSPIPPSTRRPRVLLNLLSLTLDVDTLDDFLNARSRLATLGAIIPRSTEVTVELLPPHNWPSRERRGWIAWERDESRQAMMWDLGMETNFVGWFHP